MNCKNIRTTLTEKKQENNQKFALADEKTRMAKANQFEQKTSSILMNSMIYYAFLFIPSLFLISTQGASVFTDIIPAIYYPAIVLGGSLGLGALTSSLQKHHFHIKERIKAFSKAKTESEKIVEEVQYEIEREQAALHNMALNRAETELNIQDAFSKTMTHKLLADQDINYTEEELEKNLEKLEHLINEGRKNIDTMATKLVLYNRFWRTACKAERIFDLMTIPFLGMFFTMFVVDIPFLIVKDVITYGSDLVSLLATFIPAVIGFSGTHGYLLKRNHDRKLAFKQLNSQLGNEALPNINDKSYNKFSNNYQELKQLISDQIREISDAIVKIYEEEQKQAKLMSSRENEERTECKIKLHEENIHENHLLPLDLEEEQVQEKAPTLVRKIPHHKRNSYN